MSFAGSSVLLLGGTGSVGGRLLQRLRAVGANVRVLLRQGTQRRDDWSDEIAVHCGHLGDPDSVARAAEGCDVLYHCAGEANLFADAEALSWVHVAGAENVVRAAAHVRVRRVVLLSCADATLLDRDRIQLREDQPLGARPLGAWAQSKLLAEEVALRCAQGIEVTAIRPARLWGAGDFTNAPQWCREALSGGLRLYGGGSQLYSVANIDNVVHALLLAAHAPTAAGQVFHIADGEYETAAEFFGAWSQALGLPPPRRGYGPWARLWARLSPTAGTYPEVVRRSRACLLDLQRAINDLHYQPVVSRAQAFSALAAFVQEQGGAERLAAFRRRVSDAQEVQVYVRLAAEES